MNFDLGIYITFTHPLHPWKTPQPQPPPETSVDPGTLEDLKASVQDFRREAPAGWPLSQVALATVAALAAGGTAILAASQAEGLKLGCQS